MESRDVLKIHGALRRYCYARHSGCNTSSTCRVFLIHLLIPCCIYLIVHVTACSIQSMQKIPSVYYKGNLFLQFLRILMLDFQSSNLRQFYNEDEFSRWHSIKFFKRLLQKEGGNGQIFPMDFSKWCSNQEWRSICKRDIETTFFFVDS